MATPAFIYGNALYDNRATATFNGAAIGDFTNAIDYRSDTSVQLRNTSISTRLEVTMSADTTISGWGVYFDTFNDTAEILKLYYEENLGSYTQLASSTIRDGDNGVFLDDFTEVTVLSGRKLRIVFTADLGFYHTIRQVVVGKFIQPELGQYAGLKFPTFHDGYKLEGRKTTNASYTGPRIRRTDRITKLNLEYMTQSFYRNTWQDFAAHAVKYPFLYHPDYVSDDQEGSFCFCDKMDNDKHMGVQDRMAINWTLRHKVGSGYVST